MDSIIIIEKILEDLKRVTPDKLVEPDEETSKNETVVGVMDERLKKLYALSYSYYYKERELVLAGMKILAHGEKDIPELSEKLSNNCRELSKCHHLQELADLIFWGEINQKFKTWGQQKIAVRKGFKVVVIEKDDEQKEIAQQLLLVTNMPPEKLFGEFEAFLKEKGAGEKEAEEPITKH